MLGEKAKFLRYVSEKKRRKKSVYGGCYLIYADKQFMTNKVILKLKNICLERNIDNKNIKI